jgi:hypothetical protein
VIVIDVIAVDVIGIDAPSDLIFDHRVFDHRALPLSELNSVAIIVAVPNASSPDCPH